MSRSAGWARGLPRAARVCALVALLNGLAWALLIPPFHVPDEISHFAYAQYVAESGNLPVPQPGRPPYSPQLNATLGALNFYNVIGQAGNRPPLTRAQSASLRLAEKRHESPVGPDALTAMGNPPLFYLLEAPLYLATPSDHPTDKLVVMRLLSVVLGALTALVVVLFLVELLPDDPWAWTVGGLVAALDPMFGFMSGGVNADSLLYLLSALTLLWAARCFRRGLSPRTGIALAAVAAAGSLTKPAYYGLLPGVAVTLLAGLVRRPADGDRRPAARGVGAAAAMGAAVWAFYWVATHTVLERTAAAAVAGARDPFTHSLRERLSYMWQLFLPRLPFQHDLIVGFPLQDIWSAGFIGRFGWLDYGYPSWLYDTGWWVMVLLGVLAAAGVVRHREAVRARLLELSAYAVFVAGTAFAIAYEDYNARSTGAPLFEQGRYLLPLLALWAALVAVALRGAGRRAARPLGALLVVAMIGTSIFGQMLTISRYYG